MPKIADMDNLHLAFYKAAKGKEGKASVEAYRANLEANLQQLQTELLTGSVVVGNYHYFTIYDPNEREICAAPFPQRVLHHALMNVCHPYFERKQIYDSYASRIGKGTYAALDRAQAYTQQYSYFLKLDVRKYFYSISHVILKKLLQKMFKDSDLLAIFFKIIATYEGTGAGRGVPIGNLTSQYFANHYLSIADHYAKEVLKAPAYVRYMDDMVFWHQDKKELLGFATQFELFLHTELDLSIKPLCLNHVTKGLPFVGYILSPFGRRLSQESKQRFKKKIRKATADFENGIYDEKSYQQHIQPLIAFTEKAHTQAIRQKIVRSLS